MLRGELFLYGVGPFSVDVHHGAFAGCGVMALPGCNVYATREQLAAIRDAIAGYLQDDPPPEGPEGGDAA